MGKSLTVAFRSLRLQIREFVMSDSSALFALYRLPETSQFESWEPFQIELQTRDLLKDWIKAQSDDERIEYTLAICLEGHFIGLCCVDLGVAVETDNLRMGCLSYRFLPEYWGQGYASEALTALIKFAFDEMSLHRVHAGCVVGNIASRRVMDKAGMRYEGTTRKSFPIGGQWHDYLLYGLLAEEC